MPKNGSMAIPAGTFLQFPVLVFALAVIGIAVLRLLLQRRALNLARNVARSVQTRTRAALLSAAAAGGSSADFPSPGVFASYVTEQVDMLGPYYRGYAVQSMRVRVVPLVIVAATASISWLAALILLLAGPVIPLFMALIGARAKTASDDRQTDLARLGGVLLDRIRGLETLRLFGAVERTKADIREAGEAFRNSTMQVLRIAFLSSTVLELFSALGIAFCAVFVGFSLLGDISVGTWGGPLGFAGGLFVLLLAPEFFAPMRAFASAYHDRAAGMAASEKLQALAAGLGAPGHRSAASAGLRNVALLNSSPPAISLQNVSLKLSTCQVFDRLNLHVAPGETLLVSGPSGCGKTTLLDSILGFHLPQEGQVLIGKDPVCQIVEDLRRNVMWLGQEPRLFYGTVKFNLLKGAAASDTVSERALWQALDVAGAASLVEKTATRAVDTVGRGRVRAVCW